MHPVTEKLKSMIEQNKGWPERFQEAVDSARSHNVPSIAHIKTVDDYLKFVDELVNWAPWQSRDEHRKLYSMLVRLYFYLDQPSVKDLQNKIEPGCDANAELTPLSQWIVDFGDAWGDYLDTTDSAKFLDSFKDDPLYNWDEYMPPPSGYFTFNQFFARHTKPGMRPIAGLTQDEIIVSPADCTFVGKWEIRENDKITVYGKKDKLIESKGLLWSIQQLLDDSAYRDRFRGGIFTHSFLNSIDYHRWHTPVRGKVLESKVIRGQMSLDVDVQMVLEDGKEVNKLNALDGTGYQFVQTRGLVVIDSPFGLVACLPMGMAQVSSVVITAEEGKTLHKGEELGYFQFGGSDFVMVFERASNVHLIGQAGVHVRQGEWIGTAFPYGMK